MRRTLMAGNWKMNKTQTEAANLAQELVVAVRDISQTDILVCPTYTSIAVVREVIAGTNIMLGAQNMYFEESGAYTGEISAAMLKEAGCAYVIIGHSERRQYFNEKEELLNKKIKKALVSGLIPIYCVGELKSERDAGKAQEVVERQIRGGLEGVNLGSAKELVIAYEPVWAIGTGDTATPEDAQGMHAFIRGLVADVLGAEIAAGLVIQYGGSVKPDNVDELMACPDIDGALVGGASLKADGFARICGYKI